MPFSAQIFAVFCFISSGMRTWMRLVVVLDFVVLLISLLYDNVIHKSRVLYDNVIQGRALPT